jgi:hypothetical protein
MKLHGRPSLPMALFYVALLLLLLGLGIFGPSSLQAATLGGLAAGIFVLIAAQVVLTPMQASRHYRSHKAIRSETSLDVRQDGLRFKSAEGSGDLSWASIRKWRRDRNCVLIYAQATAFYIVPTTLSSPEFDMPEFVARLTRDVGRSR